MTGRPPRSTLFPSPPLCRSDEDTALTFAASTLTTNDSSGPANESGQTLTVTAVAATAASHGTVSLDATTHDSTYNHTADYNSPPHLSYRLLLHKHNNRADHL